MQVHYILSITSDDKPGVVETVSSIIESCGGNWLESRLAHLSGKFVGVIQVGLDSTHSTELEKKLTDLSATGILVRYEIILQDQVRNTAKTAHFSAMGPDRTGIVKEISSAFALQGINVEELETNLSSMPYSGEPIFEARGIVSMPDEIDLANLHERMDSIANDLGLDLDVELSHTN